MEKNVQRKNVVNNVTTYKLKGCSIKECCKQCRHVNFLFCLLLDHLRAFIHDYYWKSALCKIVR